MIPYIKINKLHMDEIPGSEISLTGSKGDIIGITGLNGSGKTISRESRGLLKSER